MYISLQIVFIILFLVNIVIVNLLNWAGRSIKRDNSDEGFLYAIGYLVYVVINIIIILNLIP